MKMTTWAGTALGALTLTVWRLVAAIAHRHALRRLADLDDRMLADIGLTRGDLRAARAEPPWHDPTNLLARRAAMRGVSDRALTSI